MRKDQLGVGQAIQTLIPGTTVLRLVDRDDRSPHEIASLRLNGVRVLTRRHLEAYLLDDEVLLKLCNACCQPEKASEVLAAKAAAIKQQVFDRNRPSDDVKLAAGDIRVAMRDILGLTQHGNTTNAFLRDTLAPLITPGMAVYAELKRDIFDDQ